MKKKYYTIKKNKNKSNFKWEGKHKKLIVGNGSMIFFQGALPLN
jgi:hypothetical protein